MMLREHSSEAILGGSGAFLDEAIRLSPRLSRYTKDAIVLNEPAGEAKARRLVARCTELHAYIENNEDTLIDYGQRYRAGKPISTSRAEGTVNQLVNARMNKRRQMRWSPRGAHACFRSGPRCWTDASATRHSYTRRSAPGF